MFGNDFLNTLATGFIMGCFFMGLIQVFYSSPGQVTLKNYVYSIIICTFLAFIISLEDGKGSCGRSFGRYAEANDC